MTRLETKLRVWRAVHGQENPYEFATGDLFRVHSGDGLFGGKRPLIHPVECRSDEELLCSRVRKRIVVVLAHTRLQKAQPESRHGESVNCDSYIVVPSYEIVDSSTQRMRFSQETVDLARQLETPNFFFLPRNGLLKFSDSLARVDRVFTTCRTFLKPAPLRLDGEVLQTLRELMAGFIFGDLQGEMVQTYWEMVGKKVEESNKS